MTDHDTMTAKPERAWVWWCNEESISAGKISVLAIVETIAAVGLWWWLAIHYDWSWMVFISLFAAPMLLLRSPESIALGVTMLGQYWNSEKKETSAQENNVIFLVPIIATGLLSFWLANFWSLSSASQNWIRDALLIGATIFTLSFSYSIGSSINVMRGSVVGIFGGAGANAGALAGAYVVAGYFVGALVLLFTFAIAFVFKGAHNSMLVTTAFPPWTLNLLLRSQFIRWVATFRHFRLGLMRLPQNWHETIWQIDLKHLPELIPNASKINALFAVRTVRLAMLDSTKVEDKLFYARLVFAYYLPAVIYRLSLKATAWLWLPLILLLKPPFDMTEEEFRQRTPLLELKFRDRTTLSVKGFEWVILRWLAVIVLALLSISLFPVLMPWIAALKDYGEMVQKLSALFSIPPLGIRYVTLWLFAGLGLWFAKSCSNLKVLYTEWLDKPEQPVDLKNDLTKQSFVNFEQRAKTAEYLRMALIGTVWIGVYAFTATWLHDKNPTFLAPWLLRIL
ncbi:MAG: hypothetical protein PHI11_11620 [Gallionella sp.]|nr:hypothetical protein [Gallionella sp.]